MPTNRETFQRIHEATHEQIADSLTNLAAVKGKDYANAVRLCMPVYSYGFAMELHGNLDGPQDAMLEWLMQNHIIEVAQQFGIDPEVLVRDCDQVTHAGYSAAFAQHKAIDAERKKSG